MVNKNSENPIRVLRIIARMNIGGPAIQVSTLMTLLPKSRFEQLLIAGYCDNEEKEYSKTSEFKNNTIRLQQLGRAINPIKDLLSLLRIRRIILRFSPDIVHSHTFKAGLIGRLAVLSLSRSKREVIKTVHTFHGHLLYGYFGRVTTQILIFIERFLARKTNKLIAVGRAVRDELLKEKVGDSNQFQVIGPGFDFDSRQSIDIEEVIADQSMFVCGWFGRITDIKRLDRVLEIAKLVKDYQIDDIVFLVVGDGLDRNSLESQALFLQLPIIFLGWRDEVGSLLKRCNVVMCTSENEGTPISLIEAQMLGKPVISTDVGSVREVFQDGMSGFAMSYNAKTFLEKLLYLKQNEKAYEHFSKNAKSFALDNFSSEKFISNHTELYLSLLD